MEDDMHTMKILLVEDDKSLREIYGVRLLAEGYDIVSASDGEEALARVIKERPDLIISDVMMPKISGFDMLDIIRSTTETRNVKVIIMTALSSEEQRLRGESLGADRYLVKSQVGIEDVVRAVHEVLGDRPNNTENTTPTNNKPLPENTTVTARSIPSPAPSPQQSTVGERIIQPLQSSMPKPDYSSMIDDELSSAQPHNQNAIQTPKPPVATEPKPFTLPPTMSTDADAIPTHDNFIKPSRDSNHQPHLTTSPKVDTSVPLINDITPRAETSTDSQHATLSAKNPLKGAALPHHRATPADDEAALAQVLRKKPEAETTLLGDSSTDTGGASLSTNTTSTPEVTAAEPDPLDVLLDQQQRARTLTMAPDEALANLFNDTPITPSTPTNSPKPTPQHKEAAAHLNVPVSERSSTNVEPYAAPRPLVTPERQPATDPTTGDHTADSGLKFEETDLPSSPAQ